MSTSVSRGIIASARNTMVAPLTEIILVVAAAGVLWLQYKKWRGK